ncbi:restriction endonuclease subunit S [Limnospira platensis CENA597]|uniref:restriction endonuclease subunit S n=1 Tax=Limnospira platensis TaxID=118562 RepID=UPI003DA185F2
MSEWKETEIGLIPSDWHIDKLENHVQPQRGITYGIVKVGDFVPGGVPVIRGGDIRDGSIVFDDQKRVAEEVSNQFRRTILQGGEILLNLIAEPGHAAIVPDELMSSNVSRDVAVIPLDDSVDHKFVCYFLRSEASITWLTNRLQGTVTQKINLGVLRELPILLMSLDEQRRIAHFLDCLDRSISNLRNQNETLEKIAQTLFKHWFVDFEFPNADGKPYKSSGGEMMPSELGEIPVGWRVGTLGDIGRNIRNGISETEIQPEMSYIALEHMPKKQIALDSWGTAADIASNKFLFKKGNILFGKLRPYFHKVGVSFISGICSTDILVLDSKNESIFGFLLMTVSSEEFIRYVSLAAEGTRMPRTNWQYMKEYPICIPDHLVTVAFNELLKALVLKIENNIFKIQTLTQTRDALLPKLMSGKLRIKP